MSATTARMEADGALRLPCTRAPTMATTTEVAGRDEEQQRIQGGHYAARDEYWGTHRVL